MESLPMMSLQRARRLRRLNLYMLNMSGLRLQPVFIHFFSNQISFITWSFSSPFFSNFVLGLHLTGGAKPAYGLTRLSFLLIRSSTSSAYSSQSETK